MVKKISYSLLIIVLCLIWFCGDSKTRQTDIDYVKNNPQLLGVVTVTEKLKELYLQAQLPGDKIFVWPDAVDVDAFERLPAKESLRKSLGLPRDTFIATYCGHLYPDRGIEEIMGCAAALPDV